MTLDFGIHDEVPADAYHADPADAPSLSASIANILISQSPAHAWAKHPKNPAHVEEKTDDRFEIGTCAHELFLRGENLIEICNYSDWRSNAAKEARDEARSYGRIPLLPDQADRVLAMTAAARQQAHNHTAQPPLFTDGKAEQTLVWEDSFGVVCRARVDWLRDDYTAADDLKTSDIDNPYAWTRKTMWGIGAPLQARFYQRGVKVLTGIEPLFRFALVGAKPPHALSVIDLAPDAAALADAQIDYALKTWAECLATGEWPAYGRKVFSAEAPPWLEVQWLERQEIAA